MRLQSILAAACVALMAACGGSAAGGPTSPSAASAAPPTLQATIDAANKEGKVELFAPWPRMEDLPTFEQAFNKRFNTNIKIDLLSMDVTTARTRLMSGINAKPGEVDTIIDFSTDMYAESVKAGAIAKVDWLPTFGNDMPGVKDAYDSAFQEFQGYYLTYEDSNYVLYYNTKQATPDQAPHRMADLADPKFRGKIAADPRGYPFNYLVLSPDWGLDKATELVKGIAANKPLLKQGGSSIAQAVAAGEVPFGIGSYASVVAEKKKGSPIEAIVPDYVPNDPRGTVLASNAAHPNAAKLFMAWAVSDALPLWDQMYQLGRLSMTNTSIGQFVKQGNPDAKLVSAKSAQDVQTVSDALQTFGNIMRGT